MKCGKNACEPYGPAKRARVAALLVPGQTVIRVRLIAYCMVRTGRRPCRGGITRSIDSSAFDAMRGKKMETHGKQLREDGKKRREAEGDRPPPRARSKTPRAKHNSSFLVSYWNH